MKLAERWETVSLWLNTDIKVRRIDMVLLVFGVFTIAYYGYYDGWRGALLGGLVYLMMMMIGLWLL